MIIEIGDNLENAMFVWALAFGLVGVFWPRRK